MGKIDHRRKEQQKGFEVLERGFNLRLSNLTGSQAERFENRMEFMRRTSNFTIPMYDSYHDANLHTFHKHNTVCERAPLKFNKVRGLERTSMVHVRVVATQHVLDLKSYFLKEARGRPTVPSCTNPSCCAFQANTNGAPDMIHSLPYDETFPDILNCGLNVSNSHFMLHAEHPNKIPSKAVCDEVVLRWGGKTHVDWPTFLVLCTVDFASQYRDIAMLHDGYSAFNAAKPVKSELDFQKMISYLTGGTAMDGAAYPSLFQSGDFYSARHTCSFAEFVVSIQPLVLQSYIMKSNARGMKLSVNFCGHTAPGNVGGPPPQRDVSRPGTTMGLRPSSRAASLLGGSSAATDSLAAGKSRLRFSRKIFL